MNNSSPVHPAHLICANGQSARPHKFTSRIRRYLNTALGMSRAAHPVCPSGNQMLTMGAVGAGSWAYMPTTCCPMLRDVENTTWGTQSWMPPRPYRRPGTVHRICTNSNRGQSFTKPGSLLVLSLGLQLTKKSSMNLLALLLSFTMMGTRASP